MQQDSVAPTKAQPASVWYGDGANAQSPAEEHEPGTPTLLPYVLMAHQQRSHLAVRRADGTHGVLRSEAGVHQGDPMGPPLFALTYQPTLHNCSTVGQLPMQETVWQTQYKQA